MSLPALWKHSRKKHPGFFVWILLVLFVYALQLVFRTEITPLGYFSLYSNATPKQVSYTQILPSCDSGQTPLDIYSLPGSAFLMMEILPTRYEILSGADHRIQTDLRFKRMGLSSFADEKPAELRRFRSWFPVYARRIQADNFCDLGLYTFGFRDGKIIGRKEFPLD